MSDAVNRKSFKKKYFDSIKTGLETSFKNLYPNNEVLITYGPDQGYYYFNVHINGETFGIKDSIPMIVPTQLSVTRYTNEDAIVFSEISRTEYEREYDNYHASNYDWLRDEVDKLRKEYEPKGVIFIQSMIGNSGFSVEFYHPDHSTKRKYIMEFGKKVNCEFFTEHVHGYFNFSPISMGTAKSTKSKVSGSLKRLMERIQ